MEQKNTEKPRKTYKDDLVFRDDGTIRTWDDHNLQILKRKIYIKKMNKGYEEEDNEK